VFGYEGADTDRDGALNCKDTDDDNDGIPDDADPCPTTAESSCQEVRPCSVVWNLCKRIGCVDYILKLDWVVNPPDPPIEVVRFGSFWIENEAIHILPDGIPGQMNLQETMKQLTVAPATTGGHFRLEIQSRAPSDSAQQLRAVVAEYEPSQVVVLGQTQQGASVRLTPPQGTGDQMLLEASDKAEPARDGKRPEQSYAIYLRALLMLAVIAALTVIVIRRK
jgi:hypothetical protein